MKFYISFLVYLAVSFSAMAKVSMGSESALFFGLNDDGVDEGVTYEAKNDAVYFVKLIENLPLKANEIYDYSLEYLNEAYKISKYNVSQQNKDKGFLVGEGEFSSFERYGNLISQYTFSCKHSLRIDAKDGRARISVIVKEYNINREKTNGREILTKSLMDVAPIDTANFEKDDMYIKAFNTLRKIATKSINSIESSLRSKQPMDDDNW